MAFDDHITAWAKTILKDPLPGWTVAEYGFIPDDRIRQAGRRIVCMRPEIATKLRARIAELKEQGWRPYRGR